ncbi:MAG: hypothetical protein J7M19_09905 [Planctomycetes bacterium]|nr:hypothetical protein [Planctomycetota bacterium]
MSETGVSTNTFLQPIAPPAAGGARNAPIANLYKSSYLEALKYKWITSEQAGRDLGKAAIVEWLARHWKGWCRQRWVEHIMGEVYWAEFGIDVFGSLKRDFHGDEALLNEILQRIRNCAENLDIIIWATETGQNVSEVIDILVIADINQPILEQGVPVEGPIC